jgi:hypothetical protein
MLFVGGDGGNLVSGVDRERPNVLITDRERERPHVGAFFDEGLGRLDIMSSMPNFGCWAAKPGRRGMTSRIPNAPDSATPQRRAGCLGIFGIVEIAQDLSRPDTRVRARMREKLPVSRARTKAVSSRSWSLMHLAYKLHTRRSSTALAPPTSSSRSAAGRPAAENNVRRSAPMTTTALITGATSGIGRAAADKLAQSGVHVMVVGRNVERGEKTIREIRAAGGKADFISSDLRDAASARAVARNAVELGGGHVDILINNAGIFPFGPTHEMSEQSFDDVYALNVKAPYFLVAELAPLMAQRGKGAIINVSTMVADYGATARPPSIC